MILKSFHHLYKLFKIYLAIGLVGVLAALAYGALAYRALPYVALPHENYIFSVALYVFLIIGALKLTIEQLINLVILFKKLKTTITSEYSLSLGQPNPSVPAGTEQSEAGTDRGATGIGTNKTQTAS